MRTLIQRVKRTHLLPVEAENRSLSSIGKGLLILCGFEESDSPVSMDQMALKIKSLRIFSDASGKLNLSGPDVDAEYMLVSQFTLYADCRYGNRPSFDGAASKPRALEYYQYFVRAFEKLVGPEKVKHGEFGSDLLIDLVNDGPVTLFLDSRELK